MRPGSRKRRRADKDRRAACDRRPTSDRRLEPSDRAIAKPGPLSTREPLGGAIDRRREVLACELAVEVREDLPVTDRRHGPRVAVAAQGEVTDFVDPPAGEGAFGAACHPGEKLFGRPANAKELRS